MPTRTIDLSDHLDRFVEESVTSGRFQDANEVMRDALHLLEQRRQQDLLKLERLRAAVQLGEDAVARGDSIILEIDEIDGFVNDLAESVLRHGN